MKITIFVFLFLKIILTSPVYSQGFNAVSMYNENKVFVAGDNGKILKSNDFGLSWEAVSSFNVNYNSISTKNYFTHLTASDNKVYRCNTNGFSEIISFQISGNHSFNSVHFISDSSGFICGDGGEVFKTTNGGVNWSMQNSGINNVDLNSISFKDNNNGIVCADSGYIYLTSDGGNTWTPAVQSLLTNKNLLKAKYFNDGIVVAGEYGTLLLKKDSSPAWTAVNTRISSDIKGVTGTGINDVHVCGGGGFIRNNRNSNNDFTNFESNPMMANLTDIFMFNQTRGIAVSSLNSAVIKTSNGGLNWNFVQGVSATYRWERKVSHGTESNVGNTLCRHPSNRNTFFCGQGSQIFVSRNDGDDWTEIASVPGGGSMNSFYVSPLDTNVWLCAISPSSLDKVMRTSDYGQTWSVSISRNYSSFGQPLEMDQNNPSVFYFAPDAGGFYKSSDNGVSFQQISSYPFISPCDIIVTWDSSEVILIGDGPNNQSGAKIFRSADGGYNWNLVLDDSTTSEIPSMCNSVFENNVLYAADLSFLWMSTNYGVDFNNLFGVGAATWGSAVCEEDPGLILAGIYNSQCYFSFNKGIDWIHSSGSPSFAGYGLLAPAKNTLLYHTSAGIYKLIVTYDGIVSINENSVLSNAENFTLKQNYPNPFNPKTVIRYELRVSSFAKLIVYDVLGNEVATLMNENQNAGSYSVEFDGSGLSSGVYFYKLDANGKDGNNFIMSKRMVLLK